MCDTPGDFRMLYDLSLPLADKVRTVASQVYGAAGVEFSTQAATEIRNIENMGYGRLPVCIAKTQASSRTTPRSRASPKTRSP